MRTTALSSAVLLLSGCGTVEVTPVMDPDPRLPEPQYIASTFWYANNSSMPLRWLLRAAAKTCDVAPEDAAGAIQHIGPYGLYGTWLLHFSCAETSP